MLFCVCLALPASPATSALGAALRGEEILVVHSDSKDWLRTVGESAADMVVVHQSWLDGGAEAAMRPILDLPNAPSAVVLTEREDPSERARLLACGCEAVLGQSLPVETLATALAGLVRKRVIRMESAARAPEEPRLSDFVSRSASMQAFLSVARRVAKADSSLLILGETGVGKERFALAVHGEGARAAQPFVPINCAALPETLLESELFGHEKGAFTGATRTRRGAFEMAHGGTLFLDEIGDMPLHLQAKLLRVLQDRSFLRLGGETPLRVDVRIMAATNRDLSALVEVGAFRRDLFYRLSVIALVLPPLRERREDIPELVRSYLDYLAPRIGATASDIAPDAMEALERYDWPGNVRELINVLERALLLCAGDSLFLEDLPEEIAGPRPRRDRPEAMGRHSAPSPLPVDRPWKDVRREVVDAAEKEYLSALLAACGGSIADTAHRAGLTPRAIHLKMRRHGLKKHIFKEPSAPSRQST